MKKILIILLVVISACTTNTNLNEKLTNINIPESYSVHQVIRDTGFAGVNNTGGFYLNHSYVVINEIPNFETNGQIEPLTMTDIKELVMENEFSEGLKISRTRVCYLHDKFGFESAVVCFNRNTPYYYEYRKALGNHRSQTMMWQVDYFKKYEECNNLFCYVFMNALEYDQNACSSLEEFRERCTQLKSDSSN